jgi:hypothetical protein
MGRRSKVPVGIGKELLEALLLFLASRQIVQRVVVIVHCDRVCAVSAPPPSAHNHNTEHRISFLRTKLSVDPEGADLYVCRAKGNMRSVQAAKPMCKREREQAALLAYIFDKDVGEGAILCSTLGVAQLLGQVGVQLLYLPDVGKDRHDLAPKLKL